jgi:hypothetical protein
MNSNGCRRTVRGTATQTGRRRGARFHAEQSSALDVFQSSPTNGKCIMPYSRPISRFYLTAPRVPTFAISIVLALLAVFTIYGHVPQLHGINGFVMLLIAYVVLLAGTLLRGV